MWLSGARRAKETKEVAEITSAATLREDNRQEDAKIRKKAKKGKSQLPKILRRPC